MSRKFLCLNRELLFGAGIVTGRDELRQDWRSTEWAVVAALGNLNCVLKRFRQIGKKTSHIAFGLQVVFPGHLPAIIFDDVTALSDAQQSVMGFVVAGGCEIALVGGHQRNVLLIGKIQELWLNATFISRSVPLKFQI